MLVCAFSFLPNAKYSNHCIVVSSSSKSFSGKTSLPVKNSNLPTFSDNKAEILALMAKPYHSLKMNIVLQETFKISVRQMT